MWKFPCVGASLSLGAVWTLSPELERRGVCVPFLDAGGHARPVRMSPGMRWYSAVGLHTAQGISDKLRELTPDAAQQCHLKVSWGFFGVGDVKDLKPFKNKMPY